jgi:hypothetical protein
MAVANKPRNIFFKSFINGENSKLNMGTSSQIFWFLFGSVPFHPGFRLEFMIINFLPMTKENKVGSSIK